MKKAAVFSCLISLVGAAALAGPAYPTRAFDAMYQRINDMGASSYRMCTDGKGHVRTENTTPTGEPGHSMKHVMIMDYPKNQILILLDNQKLVMKMPFKGDGGTPADEARIKQMGGKSLGQKVIDGHPCHGWTFMQNGKTTESWTGDDTGCLVLSITSSDAGKEELHLVKYKAGVPTENAFGIPDGYKEIAGMGVPQ